MTRTTQAQQQRLDSAARRFEEVNGELQSMLGTLLRELEGMRHRWQGAGGRSFEAVKVSWSRDQEGLNRNLLETAEGIRTAGHNYAVSDTDAAHRLRGTSRGGTGVLPL